MAQAQRPSRRTDQHPRSGGSVDPTVQRAVDLLAAHCGEKARVLLRAGHPFLTRKVLLQLSRTSPERQRFELSQVLRGRRPFTTKTTVFDTTSYAEVVSRLARAGGYVNKAAQVLRSLLARMPLSQPEQDELPRLARSLLENCGMLDLIVRRGYQHRTADVDATEGKSSWSEPKEWDQRACKALQVRDVRNALVHAHGFVEKCVRDLPRASHLRPTRPQTHDCRVRLYGMITDTLAVLEALPDATRPTTGPTGHSRRRVATHRRPDVDALAAVWLAERYLFGEPVEVIFLPYEYDWARGPAVDCVVDMGGLHYPPRLLFDHKPPAYRNRSASCATRLVWEHLLALGRPVGHLADLVHTVHAGDSAALRRQSTSYQISKRHGLHARFDRARAAASSDAELYQAIRQWLNGHHGEQNHRRRAKGRRGSAGE